MAVSKSWFKFKKNGNGYTAASREGWLALVLYAISLGLVFAMAIWLMDKDEISNRLGIPLLIAYVIMSTMLLFRVVFNHGPGASWKRREISTPPPFQK